MSERQVVIYSAANRLQAALLQQMLDEHGIAALVFNDGLTNEGGELPLGLSTAPRVVVAASDAEEARELALRFERQIAARGEFARDEPPDMIDDSERTVAFWPQCPECARKRTTVCPYCGSSGVDFPWADEGDPTEEYPELWIDCPVCDSAYAPDYLSRCEWCGHRFPSGIKAPPERKPAPKFVWDWNARLVLVVLAAFGLLGALAAYFAWIVRQ
jgi:hypothetical protein